MDGDALIVEKAFDGRGCDADIKLAFDQRMRDAVVVAVNLNVIVNMCAGFFPFGVFIGFGGQGLEGGSFQIFKLRMARAWRRRFAPDELRRSVDQIRGRSGRNSRRTSCRRACASVAWSARVAAATLDRACRSADSCNTHLDWLRRTLPREAAT